jgi:acetoacetyl-CoA synthetase
MVFQDCRIETRGLKWAKTKKKILKNLNLQPFIFRFVPEDYDDLYKWSIEELESFWGEVWSFTQPVVSKSYDKVLAAGGHHMDDIPKWFTGCELNFAENLLKFRDFRPALYSIGEPLQFFL